MKVIFLEPYPTEGPSSRYRVEQYIPYLRANGITCMVRPFVSSAFYRILYKKGMHLRKFMYFCTSWLRRNLDFLSALSCDIVFIHLEVFPFGPPVAEWLLAKLGRKMVYDLDDAIYLGSSSQTSRFIKCLKCSWKVPAIIRLSRHVITCNEYLAGYSSRFNSSVTVIHTSVDTERFKPAVKGKVLSEAKGKVLSEAKGPSDILTIGWIGSHSTAKYLEALKGVFQRLSEKYKFRIKIIGTSRSVFEIPGIEIIYKDWKLDEEIDEFQSLDIGVYPLPDDEWTAGKTGFKTIQYMSVGIPCVVSDVNPNRVMVKEGENGFLAKDDGEWVAKLSRLLEDRALRERIGAAGRQTVLEKYSLKMNAPKVLDIVRATAEAK